MHRYEELEKLYYKKLYIRIFFSLSVFIILSILFYLFVEEDKKKVESNKVVYKEKNSTIIVSSDKKSSNIKIVIKKEKEDNKSVYIKFILPEINDTLTVENKKIIKQVSKHIVRKTPPVNNFNPPFLKIKETKVNIKKLIEDYKLNPNYHLAVLISKFYLKYNNLKEAKKWILRANNLHPELVESWLVFADILERKGQIKKAIEILKVYEETYGGNESVDEKLRELQAM